jgi:hypothetical protein
LTTTFAVKVGSNNCKLCDAYIGGAQMHNTVTTKDIRTKIKQFLNIFCYL